MNKKILLAILIAFFAGVAGTGYYFLFSRADNSGNSVAFGSFGWKFPLTQIKLPRTGTGNQVAFSSIRDPGGIPQGLPVRLKVPIINVDSAIEDALITPDGRMDVPAGSENVAWFALGPHPGQEGSAVIGGHFGIVSGVPTVFYNLDKLVVGDKAYIEDDEGNTLAFQVRTIKLFDRNADATTVFTSDDGLSHLNLITCEGIWNQTNGAYPSRRVVFMDAIPSEGAIVVNPVINPIVAPVVSAPVPVVIKPIPEPAVIFQKTLRIGSKGADVVALQNALIQKGFLKITSGANDGSFGPKTRAALAKYQTNAGLPPDGVLGLSTRIKLNADLAAVKARSPVAVEPTLPSTATVPIPSTVSSSTATSQTFSQSIGSLFATPTDSLITALLVIGIIFITFKIIY
jgi:LPXTG-site transpeptidase (sortase) family protein